MLKVHQLKAFDSVSGEIDNVSFEVKNGEVAGVIGPFNSGKWVVSQAISGVSRILNGEVTVNHYRLKKEPIRAKNQLGYLSANFCPPKYLTGFEYLEYAASSFQISPHIRVERIRQLSEQFTANEILYTPLDHCSKHTVQLVGYLAAVIHDPKVLVIEEPIQNLDPSTAGQVVTDLKARVKSGASLLLVSDNLNLMEELSDNLLVFDRGELVMSGTARQLANQLKLRSTSLAELYQSLFG